MDKSKRIFGIIPLVAVLFLIGIVLTGFITFYSQHAISDQQVMEHAENLAAIVSSEVREALREFPAYQWLLKYWYEHDSELDIAYDEKYGPGTRTEGKCMEFTGRHPDLELRYLKTEDLEALPAEDQKLYAEITYSWFITHLNEIKASHRVDYLFGVVIDETFESQYFLFSAADPESARGTSYLQIYPLGTVVSVADNPELMDAMNAALRNRNHFAVAGNYVDYYAFLSMVGKKPLLVGTTYNLSVLRTSVEEQALRGTIYAILIFFILMAICLVMIYCFVLRPLKMVQTNMRIYQQTKDGEAVRENLSQIRSRNEIGRLSRDMISLTAELDEHMIRIESITAEKERIGAEIELASRIQESILPNDFPAFPERKDFDIYASMTPAKGIGGDFYDFFLIDEDHLAIVIADVSGKGVPAALFMQVSMLLIHNTVLSEKNPARAMEIVNEQISEHNREEMFVSVWLGILDLKTGLLKAANAGHEYPVLKEPDGIFEMIKDCHGIVIGAFPTVRYTEYEMLLKPGAKLFLYTDGVPEASDPDSVLFGTDRMLAALAGAKDGTPEEILCAVKRTIREFECGAPQFDDLTMLCLHYKGTDQLA